MSAATFAQFVVAGLKNGAIYALMALGFTIVYGATGVINFAQGEFYMLGGMLLVWAFAGLGLPLPAAVLVAVVVATAAGAAFELLAIRPRRDGDPLALIIITIGGSMLVSSLARHVFGPNEIALRRPGGMDMNAFTPGDSIMLFGAAIERQALWIWGLTALAVVLLVLLYRRTRLGMAMRACAVDRQAARLVGIDVRRIVTVSFAFAAGLGALAGAAVTPLTQTAFDVGARMGLKGFAAAILGGLGDPVGAVAGGLALGLIESIAIGFVPATYKDAIALLVLLFVLFVRPQGLMGGRRREKV